MDDTVRSETAVEPLWRSDAELRTAIQVYLDGQELTTEQFEDLGAYCLYVIQGPCYYETQAYYEPSIEEERERFEICLEREVKTVGDLRLWVREVVRKFGIDPF